MIKKISIAATFLVAMQVHAVNKCTDANGRVVFQDGACPNSGITVGESIQRQRQEREALNERQRRIDEAAALRIKRLDEAPYSSLSYQERLERDAREAKRESENYSAKLKDGSLMRDKQAEWDKYCNGAPIGSLSLGLTETQVLKCSIYYQIPDKVNTTTAAGSVTKQYVFRPYGKGSAPEYLYFTNGVLTAIQN